MLLQGGSFLQSSLKIPASVASILQGIILFFVLGSEFFVRASARVMDEAGLDRDGISRELESEARTLLQGGTLAAVMPVCLSALEASEK